MDNSPYFTSVDVFLMEVHFENIKTVLLRELNKAKHSIHMAIAWLSDKELIDTLCNKAANGVIVFLIINDDDINEKNGETFINRLQTAGGMVFKIGGFGITMHHKFCVIDHNIVINGSYNWTNKASSNHENITITHNVQLATHYISEIYCMWKSERLLYGDMTCDPTTNTEVKSKLDNVEDNTKIQERLRIGKAIHLNDDEMLTALLGTTEPK